MDTFHLAPASSRMQNTQFVKDDWQIQNVPVAIFLIILGAYMNVLLMIKVKTLKLIKWS